MKKFFMLLSVVFMTIVMSACGKGNDAPTADSTDSGTKDPIETTPIENPDNDPITDEKVGFVIHFEHGDKKGDKFVYNLWMWEKNKDGADYQFNGTDSFGAYAKYKFKDFSDTLANSELGFIIKTNKKWEEGPTKDYDGDRFIKFSTLDKDKYGYYHVWILSKDKNIYTSPNLTMKDIIETFRFEYVANRKMLMLMFATNNKMKEFKLYRNTEVILDTNSANSNKDVYLNTTKSVSLNVKDLPNLSDVFKVEVTFKDSGQTQTAIADTTGLFATPEFEAKYTYDGELGAIYTPMGTTFKVWSPISSKMSLRIYENGTPTFVDRKNGSNKYEEHSMTMDNRGVWSAHIPGDLDGKYYTYVVTNSRFDNREICDPYAKATGVNGYRGMILNFDTTNPAGWEDIQIHPYSSTELTVYETHIADLTSSDTWNGTKANSKKFKGFYEEGTTYTENGVTVKTGFDHIKELGVNAVQILPFFDSANDEINTEFNWGYNPLNYNSLDGSFASNPLDGRSSVREFKELVKAYHDAGINIIMDVVYNHVNGLQGSNFDVLMPGYYFRYYNGTPSNGSGCGNETASERYMFRKFMKDSTEFWASEYKLGGFRFDLMGIHDIETMNQLAENLHTNVDSHITIYGEPWAGGSIAMSPDSTPAEQSNMKDYKGYGCFNDKMRDALIKGGLSGAAERGWITNNNSVNGGDVNTIKNGMKGGVLPGQSIEAEKCVNYVTCHDNYTLYDRIKAAGIKDEAEIKKMAMLANSVVFTSQGITFMLSGEEFLREKDGNSNSYNASYELNALDYSLKIKNLDMFHNYQKLIALKQNKELFGRSNADCAKLEIKSSQSGNMIYFDLIDNVNHKLYRIAHCNGVVSADAVVDFAGFELYLDTLNTSSLELTANTKLSQYQTIIATKNI